MTLRSFNFLIVMLLMLAIGAGLGILFMTSNSSAANATADAPQASATPATSTAIRPAPGAVAQMASEQQVTEQYVGVTFARQAADIVARSEGRLEAVYVNLGDRLKSGAVIGRIESSSTAQLLEIAKSSLRSAQAEERNTGVELKDAEARYSRRETLAEAGVLSKEELATAKVQVEKAKSNLEVAHAHVAEQVARVKQANESLANAVIRAPFDGTVTARYLDAGATVHSGTPVINLMRSDDLWVRFAIPEEKRSALSAGAIVSVRLEGLNETISGTVEHTAPGVDASSREVVIEAQLKVPGFLRGQIKPGLSGYVSTTGK